MRTQKANDNGTPIVGTETSLSKVLPLYDIFEYDEATHTLTLGTNLYVDGEIYPFVMAKYYRNQGDWSATGSYEVNDIVDYQHIKYVCIEDVSENDESPATDTDHWEVFTELKTINGNSLFGDGDLTITTSGTLSIDTELDATSENAVQNKAIAVEMENKANTDGYYEEMTVGSANQLLLNRYINDLEPYNYRTSGGSADIGDRVRLNKLVGGSVVLNQLVQNGNFASTTGWNNLTTFGSVSDNIATFTANQQYVNINRNDVDVIKEHKYLIMGDIKLTSTTNYNQIEIRFNSGGSNTSIFCSSTTNWQTLSKVFECDTTSESGVLAIRDNRASDWDAIQVKNFMVIDLTQMLGSEVADRLYALEQASAGAGVKAFRDWFSDTYYAYDTGTMLSTKASKKNNVGFNQWDEDFTLGRSVSTNNGGTYANSNAICSTNFVKVLPNTNYCFTCKSTFTNGYIVCYDINENFIFGLAAISESGQVRTTPNNCAYIKFSFQGYGATYNHDICINLSWSGTRNGEYEAYEVNSYDLPNVVLRGLYKVDDDGNFYFDGDYITPDGTITRRFGIVDLGTLDWTHTDADTSYERFTTTDLRTYAKPASSSSSKGNILCSKYETATFDNVYSHSKDKIMSLSVNSGIAVYDSTYSSSTAEQFKTAMSGVYLIYELATPTTETSTSYQQLEIVNDWGTEEFVCVGYDEAEEEATEIAVPMGHDSDYYTNASDKLANAPDLPSDTGDYIMHYNASDRSAEYELLGTYLNNNGYVKPTEITGYDATATQILKNVNGTLTWVDE